MNSENTDNNNEIETVVTRMPDLTEMRLSDLQEAVEKGENAALRESLARLTEQVQSDEPVQAAFQSGLAPIPESKP